MPEDPYCSRRRKGNNEKKDDDKGKIEIVGGSSRTCPAFPPVHIGKKFSCNGKIEDKQRDKGGYCQIEKSFHPPFFSEEKCGNKKAHACPQGGKVGRNGAYGKNTPEKVGKCRKKRGFLYKFSRCNKGCCTEKERKHIY